MNKQSVNRFITQQNRTDYIAMNRSQAQPAPISGLSRTFGTSTIQGFLQQPVTNRLIVPDRPREGEIKVPGIAAVGVEALGREGIVYYYDLLGALLQRDFYKEDCKTYLDRLGLATNYTSSVVICCWNHLRFAELGRGPSNQKDRFRFHNGKLVSKETNNPDEVYIDGIDEHTVRCLKGDKIETYFQLIGKMFSLYWEKPDYNDYIRHIKVDERIGQILWDQVREVIHLDELQGRV